MTTGTQPYAHACMRHSSKRCLSVMLLLRRFRHGNPKTTCRRIGFGPELRSWTCLGSAARHQCNNLRTWSMRPHFDGVVTSPAYATSISPRVVSLRSYTWLNARATFDIEAQTQCC